MKEPMNAAELDLRAACLKLSAQLDFGLIAASAPRPFVELVAGPQAPAKIAFCVPSAAAWLLFDGAADARLSRINPTDRPVLDLEAFAQTNRVQRGLRLFTTAHDVQHRREVLAEPVLKEEGRLPRRDDILALASWRPLIERTAYLIASRACTVLDERRRRLLRSPKSSSSDIAAYWSLAHAAAHATVIACSPDARPWLVEMSRTFTWSRWTPTFSLNRDRTVWLTACGAHAAAAFGPDVVDPYLSILGAARHPFTSFDALAGLVAIAESTPSAAREIRRGIKRMRAFHRGPNVPFAEHHEQAFRAALDLLDRPCSSFPNALADGLSWDLGDPCWASRAALTEDSAGPLATTALVGLAIAPIVLAHPVEALYPHQALEMSELIGAWEARFSEAWSLQSPADQDRPH